IADREDDAVAEAVERDGNVVAGDEKPGLRHHLLAEAFSGEVFLEGAAARSGIAEAKALLRLAADPSLFEIGPDARPALRLEFGFEEAGGGFDDIGETRLPLL